MIRYYIIKKLGINIVSTANIRSLSTVILFAFLFASNVYTQSVPNYSETIYLHTDRDYYISGENLLFKAYLTFNTTEPVKSKILYVEIVGLNASISHKKAFHIRENAVEGVFTIPDSIASGSFILRAYTNWHLNFDNRYAFYKELIIINRFGQYGKLLDIDPKLQEVKYDKNTVHDEPISVTIKKDSLYLRLIQPPEKNRSMYSVEIMSEGEIIANKYVSQDSDSIYLGFSKRELPMGNLLIRLKEDSKLKACRWVYNDFLPYELSLETDKLRYKTRQLVKLTVQLSGSISEITTSDLSATVIVLPKEEILKEKVDIKKWMNSLSEIPEEERSGNNIHTVLASLGDCELFYDEVKDFKLKYPIEFAGKIISGKVINKRTGNIVSGAKVFFSFKDAVPYLDYDLTDSSGKFYINIPPSLTNLTGFVQIWDAPMDINECEINLFEQEYNAINLPTPPVFDAEFLKDVYAPNIKAFEVNELFSENWFNPKNSSVSSKKHPIYEGHSNTINPKDFVKLNNFAEIVKEILPGVKMETDEQGIGLRIMDEFHGSYYNDAPLVFINGMPIKNYNYLSALNSDDILSIDVVRKYFVVGNIIFHGVLAIELKKELNLDYLNEKAFYSVDSKVDSEMYSFRYPNYETDAALNSRKPDFRNTIYWEPQISLVGNKAEISFYTSDMQGDYRIQIEGLIDNIYPVTVSKKFSVINNL